MRRSSWLLAVGLSAATLAAPSAWAQQGDTPAPNNNPGAPGGDTGSPGQNPPGNPGMGNPNMGNPSNSANPGNNPNPSMGNPSNPSPGSPGMGSPSPSAPSDTHGPTGTTGSMGHETTGNLSASDRQFIQQAAAGSLAEVQLGHLAVDKGESPEVKSLGQKLIDDHSRAIDQLKQIADARGVTLPADQTAEQKAAYDKLSKLSGKDFDKAFLKEVEKGHDRGLALYKKEASHGRDAELKSFAQQMVPMLRTHDDMAHRDLKRM